MSIDESELDAHLVADYWEREIMSGRGLAQLASFEHVGLSDPDYIAGLRLGLERIIAYETAAQKKQHDEFVATAHQKLGELIGRYNIAIDRIEAMTSRVERVDEADLVGNSNEEPKVVEFVAEESDEKQPRHTRDLPVGTLVEKLVEPGTDDFMKEFESDGPLPEAFEIPPKGKK